MARNPVLLVHGIYDTVALFRRMKPYLEQGGLSVHGLNLVPNNGNAALNELAQQLDLYVRANFTTRPGHRHGRIQHGWIGLALLHTTTWRRPPGAQVRDHCSTTSRHMDRISARQSWSSQYASRKPLLTGPESRRRDARPNLLHVHLDTVRFDDRAGQQFTDFRGTLDLREDPGSPAIGPRFPGIAVGSRDTERRWGTHESHRLAVARP